jgi:hypothetical protein
MSDVMLDEVVALALQLSPVDKVRLIKHIAMSLEDELPKFEERTPSADLDNDEGE